MNRTLNALERKILRAIQHGMPLSRTPYQELSQTIGIPVGHLLTILRQWKVQGKIRRLGAFVNHFQMGQGVGAMVVWKVSENKTDSVGELFASFPAVSHAYLRCPLRQWPYNLYTMVHARSDSELQGTIESMRRQSGITEFRVLKTIRELKKVPPMYLVEQ